MSKSGGKRLQGVLLVGTLLLVAVGSAGLGFVWNLDSTVNDNLTRVDGAFPAEAGRPKPLPAVRGQRPVTLLFLGSNSLPGAARATGISADTIMVVRVSRDRERVDVVSIPADAIVEIPGFGRDRISSATTRGGLALSVETVEKLLQTRIDHVGVLDLNGVVELTDAVGGVDVEITTPFTAGGMTYSAGTHHVDGEDAVKIVREQRSLPGGDLDRTRNQQAFVAALAAKLASTGTIGDPVKLRNVLAVGADSAVVDSELDPATLRSLAISLRQLRAGDVHFWTAPVESVQSQGSGPLTVSLASDGIATLQQTLAEDSFSDY